jgi:hypothetical protein
VNIGMVLDSHSTAMVIDQHSVAEDTEDVGHHSTGVLRMWLVWAPVPLVRRSLVPLREPCLWVGTRMGVTPRCLSLEPPLFGIHLSTLIVYRNGMVHQCLIIRVSGGLQLQPKIII